MSGLLFGSRKPVAGSRKAQVSDDVRLPAPGSRLPAFMEPKA
jgi:hypothetical protein